MELFPKAAGDVTAARQLIGPDGRPISSEFKKAKAPATGPSFGQWSGSDVSFYTMPGGGVLSFDLSALTMEDYRAMRHHPQINASMSVLTFMVHQVDWHIECEDQKIADMVEENLREIWTRLVRAMSQAFWAGFSPCALEYENDVQNRQIKITKVKDLIPESCQVNWKEVKGAIPPGAPPGAIAEKHLIYDGIKQYGSAYPIPVENCVHPDTPILCADFQWRPAGELRVGQEIIAFDEEDARLKGGKGGRQYRRAVIEVNNAGQKPSVEVRTDTGDPIIASTDHPFLVRVPATTKGVTEPVEANGVDCPRCGGLVTYKGRGPRLKYCSETCQVAFLRERRADDKTYSDHWVWKDAKDLEPGDKIAWFSNPWVVDDSRGAGWLAGMFDGEGHLSDGGVLSISQNVGPVLDRLKSELTDRGYEFTAHSNERDTCVQLVLTGGRRATMRLLTEIQPTRFLARNLDALYDGVWLKNNKSVDLATVEVVEDMGVQPIASIQTSAATFITGGALTHNTFWYPMLMENGDYYGRKLLKAAFMPWYFSILVHLFANRYFERFGEPVVYGRAPFDEEIVLPDGTTTSGKEAMEDIVANLRNRSVVVLPSDRDPAVTSAGANKAYIYELEYLECVDTETEIFTADGWKFWNDLQVGDDVLTLNHDTGLSEFQMCEKVNIHDVEDREMLSMEGSTHSSLTTMGHRWPVLHTFHNGGNDIIENREWRFSGEFKQRDRVPLIADRCDFPTLQKWDDALVELVAWYWTEGYTYRRDGEPINYISITQKKYPEKIKSALTRLWGAPVDEFPRHVWGAEPDDVPRWRCTLRDDGVSTFFLNHEASRQLQEVAPDRIVRRDFILSLTKAQLDLYIDAALLADGNVTKAQSFLMQKDKRKAELFQFACVLAGHATSMYPQEEKRHENYLMWVVSMRRQTVFNPKVAHKANGNFLMSKVNYTGKVWCPTTPNETWLARRNGKVYFTGNSQMRGADFERYLERLDEEMSLALFMPMLLMRTAGEGSHNLGVQHTQTWLWSLNAITGDMKEYIDRYICERLKAINFTPNAPKCEWVPRKMGKQNAETLRAVVTELVRNGGAKADLEELGTSIGLTLSEVREVTSEEDPDDRSDPDDRQRTERDRSRTGPRGVGEPRATGAEIVNRIKGQVDKAFRESRFGSDEFNPTMGYRRRFEESLRLEGFTDEEAAELTSDFYEKMDNWLKVAIELGPDEYAGPSDFVAMFQRRVDAEIESLREGGK